MIMKSIIISVLGGLVLIIAGAVVWYFVAKPAPQQAVPQPNVTLPSAGNNTPPVSQGGSAGGNMSIRALDGSSVVTRMFLEDADTAPDSINQGYYTLNTTNDSDFLVTYIAATQYFNIELIKEPVGQSRTEAEQFLARKLGLARQDMCRLNYQLSTPSSVNAFYGGQDLGFSFCPGATKLPQ